MVCVCVCARAGYLCGVRTCKCVCMCVVAENDTRYTLHCISFVEAGCLISVARLTNQWLSGICLYPPSPNPTPRHWGCRRPSPHTQLLGGSPGFKLRSPMFIQLYWLNHLPRTPPTNLFNNLAVLKEQWIMIFQRVNPKITYKILAHWT